MDRDKGYQNVYTWAPWKKDQDADMDIVEGKWFNSWQFELALMAGIGARAGINLAELFDFVLGWTTLDICDDDLASIEKRERELLRENSFSNAVRQRADRARQ